MAFCASCGSEIPAGTMSCPKCGGGGGTAVATTSASGLTDNVAGALAYFTIVPAIVFLVLEPYNKKRFIRFHAFQCLFLFVACVAIGIAFMIVGMIPVINLLLIPISVIVWLGVLAVVIICMAKAYQNQMFKLPIIGDMAEKQAGAA